MGSACDGDVRQTLQNISLDIEQISRSFLGCRNRKSYNHIQVNTTLNTEVTIVMITASILISAFLLYMDRHFGPGMLSEHKALCISWSIWVLV